ncbi:hypothetical protein [Streptomyces fuscigenes]|uniref:hypothetical protein n=1 Tax=Streptomyces fuscigenes TaxID=1528880 RepID=UPI001F1BE9A0|nr:hypothetical protein [Streptomyces fuscigenes]MCF3960291.1 hypothetical protein [Streptomyces fuscigenes]
MARLKVNSTSDQHAVREGDAILVDHNLHATLVRAVSPGAGDDETGEWFHGQVEVRFSWGAVETIDDVRAGLLVDEG